MIDKIIIIEFSLAQKCFHKQSLTDMLKQNLGNVMIRNQTDYMPIGIALSNEQADKFIETVRKQIKDYTMYKNIEGETVVVG